MVANGVSQTTPMEIDTDSRKRKETTAPEEILPSISAAPTRLLRPQNHRGLADLLKKILKEGQKTD